MDQAFSVPSPSKTPVCPSTNKVKGALNESVSDIKSKIARKLGLSIDLAENQLQFGFEAQEISRVEQSGNKCNYYIPSRADPVLSILIY